jgi:hypothetical protein
METEPDAFVKKEFVRGLNHNAGAIAGIDFATAGTPMLHVFKDRECI